MPPARPVSYDPPITHEPRQKGVRLTDQDGNDPEPAGVRIGRSTGAMIEEQQAAARAASNARDAARRQKWTGTTSRGLEVPNSVLTCSRCGATDLAATTTDVAGKRICIECAQAGDTIVEVKMRTCSACGGSGEVPA